MGARVLRAAGTGASDLSLALVLLPPFPKLHMKTK